MKRIRVASALICTAFAWNASATDFTLSSPSFESGATLQDANILNGFGCTGKNLSPALAWTDAPPGTESFAITVYDPDAPSGSGWWHWVVFDIPATAHSLAEGVGNSAGKGLPAGAVQGRTDFGIHAYGGACPPAGDKPHRYIFTVYALKVKHLDVPNDASAAMIGFMINGSKIASASIQAFYAR